MVKEAYSDLVFKLGDLARENLAEVARPPKAMRQVFRREDELTAARELLSRLEAELNGEDEDYRSFLDQQEGEKAELQDVVWKWKKAVAGVDARSRELTKKLASHRATHRYVQLSLQKATEAHEDLEMREAHNLSKIALSQENLKKTRLHAMRDQRNLEDLERELKTVLTPRPGQPGAQGILAHKRLLEMEVEAEDRLVDHEQRMKDLDAEAGRAEEDVKVCEQNLDAALYDLGEEVYADRVAHVRLTPWYVKLDRAK
jgi:hypothetical protein